MKFSKLLSFLTSLTLGFTASSVVAAEQTTTLADSGIDYTETIETINNPGAGYTSTLWYTCKPGETPIKNPSGNLVLMFINIGAFSSGANGTTAEDGTYTEGTDYDLDQTFFEGLRGTFENCRKNGCTIALRFRYDENGKNNPEPATFEQVKKHISQIKENGILEDYKDLLMFVESGFVGAWGEQHSGKYTSLEYKAELLDAMLDMVPDDIPVTVRTPNIFAKWAGIEMSEIDSWVSEPGSDAARVGMYDDGYMGSDSDLGTYSNREKETTWLGNQTVNTYFGGEFSGNLDWAKKYDTYLPENAIPEMYKTHLSYINSNIYNLYNDYTFNESYDTVNTDNSAYYGQTVFKFIRDHLGYRFVLRDSDISEQVSQGSSLTLDFCVENTGFANPIRPQTAEIILEKDGNYITTEIDVNSKEWLSCTSSDELLNLRIPGGLETGKWNAYIRLSVSNQSVKDGYKRTVKFANNDIWNASLGANFLGTFEVTKAENNSDLTQNLFYQENSGNPYVSDAGMYTVNNIIMLDGVRSGESEWTDSLLKAENADNKLYITNDDEYLYIMAQIIQNASAPVYNLQIKNADENNKFYWIYYASNGFVYFNNGSYDGCECKRTGNYVEFKIPFGTVMNIYPNTTLSSVRVSIQDSANDWINVGELTAENYTVSDTFDIYSVCRNVTLNKDDFFAVTAECSLENASYQWFKDGEIIQDETYKTYTITNADTEDIGKYTVQITSESGTIKTAEICNILSVIDDKYDVNKDRQVNIDDISCLSDFLLKISEGNTEYDYDVNDDNKINIFDFVILKRELS